jgi:hypothetical protein
MSRSVEAWKRGSVVVACVAVVLACMGAGCQLTSQERIDRAEQALAVVQQVSVSLDAQIAAVRTGIEQVQATLDDPNLTSEAVAKLQAAMVKGDQELARLQTQKVKVDSAIGKVQTVISAGPDSGADVSDELQLLGSALVAASSAASGDIALWLKLAGGALITLSTLVAGWSATKLATVKTALTEVVAGGEKFKASVATLAVTQPDTPQKIATEVVDAFRAAQNKTQMHESTKILVAQTQEQLAS